jgi:hypothetical protein
VLTSTTQKQTLENSGRRPHRRIANTQSSTAQNPIDQTLARVTIPLFPREKSYRRKLERIIKKLKDVKYDDIRSIVT